MEETRAHPEAVCRALRRESSTVFRFGYGVPALGPSTLLVQSSRKRDLSCSVVKVHSLLKQDCGRVQASSTPPWACPVSCLDKPQSASRPASSCAARPQWPGPPPFAALAASIPTVLPSLSLLVSLLKTLASWLCSLPLPPRRYRVPQAPQQPETRWAAGPRCSRSLLRPATHVVTPLWDIRLAPQFVPSLEEFLLHLN